MNSRNAIAASVAHRSWSALAGLATIWAVSNHLTLAEQGYYYTFINLLALQVVFELGFSVVLLQFAAHEAAHLCEETPGVLSGPALSLSRLRALIKLAVKWYAAAGILVLLVVAPTGWYFFSGDNQGGSVVEWEPAWWISVLGLSFVISFTGILSVIEGLNKIQEVAQLRLCQEVVGYLFFWACLFAGGGLLSFALLYLGRVLVLFAWALRTPWRRFLWESALDSNIKSDVISWKKEILPFQWRIALSWLCGYFIFALLTPMVFKHNGPEAAGQFGITMTLFTGVTTIAMIWVNTRVPILAGLISRKEYVAVINIHRIASLQSLAICCLGILAVFILFPLMETYLSEVRSRFLSTAEIIPLAAVSLANQIIFSIAVLARAEKREPFLGPTIVSAVVIPVACYSLVQTDGVWGLLLGYMAVSIFWGLPTALVIYSRIKRRWL